MNNIILSVIAIPLQNISKEVEHIDIRKIIRARSRIFLSKIFSFKVIPNMRNPIVSDINSKADGKKCIMPVFVGKKPIPIRQIEPTTNK